MDLIFKVLIDKRLDKVIAGCVNIVPSKPLSAHYSGL